MNLEQREKVYRSIQKLEGLLVYAVRHGKENFLNTNKRSEK